MAHQRIAHQQEDGESQCERPTPRSSARSPPVANQCPDEQDHHTELRYGDLANGARHENAKPRPSTPFDRQPLQPDEQGKTAGEQQHCKPWKNVHGRWDVGQPSAPEHQRCGQHAHQRDGPKCPKPTAKRIEPPGHGDHLACPKRSRHRRSPDHEHVCPLGDMAVISRHDTP